MDCERCGRRKPTRNILEELKQKKKSVNWCDSCINESELVKLQPIKEDGMLLAIDSSDIKAYGDYSVEYIENKDQLKEGQKLLKQVVVLNEEKLTNQLDEIKK